MAALTAKDAIEHLKQLDTPYDLICLDHDLVGVFCPSDAESGYAVAEVVADLPDALLPKKVIVHSWNYDPIKTPQKGGVGNMMDVLQPLEYRDVAVVAAPFDTAEFWDGVEI